jgi:hypothetical protein
LGFLIESLSTPLSILGMTCSICGKLTTFALASLPVCNNCVAAREDLFYSLEYLTVIDQQLDTARQEYRRLADRGLGDDRLMNPNKGRGQLNSARSSVKSLESTRRLIRSILIGRGALERELDEELDHAFPEAKHGQVVEWKGHSYRRQWIHDGYDAQGGNIWSGVWGFVS